MLDEANSSHLWHLSCYLKSAVMATQVFSPMGQTSQLPQLLFYLLVIAFWWGCSFSVTFIKCRGHLSRSRLPVIILCLQKSLMSCLANEVVRTEIPSLSLPCSSDTVTWSRRCGVQVGEKAVSFLGQVEFCQRAAAAVAGIGLPGTVELPFMISAFVIFGGSNELIRPFLCPHTSI